MQPLTALSTPEGQRTFSASFIRGPFDDVAPWFDPSPSFVVYAPPRPKRRRRRPPAWRTRADAYAALLTGDEYAEAARAALRDRDDAAALQALEVLRSIADVILAKLRGSSSKQLSVN